MLQEVLWYQIIVDNYSVKGEVHLTFGLQCHLLELCRHDRGGTIVPPPCHVFAYNRANTPTSVLKNLTLPNYEFGKGQYAFFPMKFSRFGERNKVCQKYQKFIRRDSHKLGETPLDLQENSKVKHHFWGFKASKVHESSWIWSVIYWMKMTFFCVKSVSDHT